MRQRFALSIALLMCLPAPLASETPLGTCLPPEEQFAFEPPRNDPELFKMVRGDYQTYLTGLEDYIRCLDAERTRAIRAGHAVLARYVEYFGDEATLQYREGVE